MINQNISIKKNKYNYLSTDIKKAIYRLGYPLGSGTSRRYLKCRQYNPYCCLAFQGEKLIGWCLFFPEVLEVHFYIRTTHRRKGFAKLLANQMIQYLKRKKLSNKVSLLPHDPISFHFLTGIAKFAETQNFQFKISNVYYNYTL